MGKSYKYLFVLSFTVIGFQLSNAQEYGGFYFGIKGGPTVGFQKWNSYERDPLLRYHGIVFIETASEEAVGLFAQAGYHVKGSAIRTPSYFSSFLNRDINGFTTPFEFHNLSLTLGAKQKFEIGIDKKVYYLFGIRGDYSVNTHLRPEGINEDDPCNSFYPFEDFVQKINYGLTLGGGIEINLSDFVAIITEVTVNPDVSKQYRQPEIPGVLSCGIFSTGTRTLGEREIVNNTLEISLGFRFLRRIEYID